MKIYHKWNCIGAAGLLMLGLCACGSTAEEKELADFSEAMSDFTESIEEADTKINELDTTKNESVDELLSLLDGLDAEFQELAELSVPEQYQSIEKLADEASENMSNAVSYFHTAYEAEEFDSDSADIAYQYYTRAMTRVEYIGYVLVGEIPENENVTVEEGTEDSRFIDKLLDNED